MRAGLHGDLTGAAAVPSAVPSQVRLELREDRCELRQKHGFRRICDTGSWPSGEMMTSTPVKVLGILLIVIIGLLNFHIPHFLLESRNTSSASSDLLELVLLANVIGALVAAVGILRDVRWAWYVGVVVVGIAVVLYLAQETVGLPGLPKAWLEPSRIVALLVEALFVILAWRQLGRRAVALIQPVR